MIIYIGDISKRDAEVLWMIAERSTKIIEFGSGASTQVLAHYTPGLVRSVETEPIWIDRTKMNLELLNITKPVEFYAYGDDPEDTYDFIFSDGLPELRFNFAMKHWPMLMIGGWLGFHDTRRDYDFFQACRFMQEWHSQIHTAQFNVYDSNITLIQKRAPLMYDDWNKTEGREPWQYGHTNPDLDALKVLQGDNAR